MKTLPRCEDCNEIERVECGCCCMYHYPDSYDDCRNDLQRFPSPCKCIEGDNGLDAKIAEARKCLDRGYAKNSIEQATKEMVEG